jgi:cyclo(L-tyrosyl-L-tyrosyl) synthase
MNIDRALQADSFPVEIQPINEKSYRIYNLKNHALIGVSPFNSYFNEPNLIKLIEWALSTFENTTIFIPDQLSTFTLLALGYSEKRAAYKVHRQDTYLNNKVIRAFKAIGFEQISAEKMIKSFTEISENNQYKKIYEECLAQFDQCEKFRNGCMSTSSWILQSYSKHHKIESAETNVAVKYFLKELPLFLDTPSILNVESSLFVYHKIPFFLQSLYLSNTFISNDQGFLRVNLE